MNLSLSYAIHFKDSPSLTYVMGLMDSKNKVTIYTDVVPDPPITHVVKGIEFMEGIKPTVIIAIGGAPVSI